MADKVGVWIVGAYGDVATTAMVGARAVARGRTATTGLVTELPDFKGLEFAPLSAFVFGGCDLRRSTVEERAREIEREHGLLSADLIDRVSADLVDIDEAVTLGVRFARRGRRARAAQPEPLRKAVERIEGALAAFRRRAGVDRVVVVNLASTEPIVPDCEAHHSLDAFEAALDAGRMSAFAPSVLYAYAAFRQGCAFVNFTPSRGPRVAALNDLAYARGVPYCGSDGKTGETLVKTALAPMFAQRNLRVLSWLGFNLLGNNDGRVLADPRARASKLATKGGVLPAVLGYAPHTKVAIDYVPSLGDWKTAWDFIHFEGFLGTKMAMQFTWQGADSALAAPLVLDLVRFSDLALRRREAGPLTHLASFFKDPIGVGEHGLAAQFQLLVDYASR